MNQKTKIFLFFLIGALVGMFAMYVFNNYKIEKKNPHTEVVSSSKFQVPSSESEIFGNEEKRNNYSSNIDELTREDVVIDYVKKNHRLPDYYITKNEAKNQGWIASQGNLCDVLPGRAIGGDKFTNREKQLPKGEQYYEADVNYNCGRRNADRIVFTKNGDVWLTHNHYKSFEKQ
ncbi:MAG: ribonuclease domain-containing protein [Bergeyella sp.]